MISTFGDLRRIIAEDKEANAGRLCPSSRLVRDENWQIVSYQKLLRWEEFLRARRLLLPIALLVSRRVNRLGARLGFSMSSTSFEGGLVIWHYGGIVINGSSKIGHRCVLHGNNCIGNNGVDPECPTLGDGVDVGYGASILGGIEIADNVKIGVGAVVVKSCLVEGATLVGIPARQI